MMAEPLAAALHGVAKHYHGFTLGPLNLEIPAGSIVGLIGENGAGKTTVLNLLGGMDKATSGRIIVGDKEITGLRSPQLTEYRRHDVGFVFQFYNLMPSLTALENVMFGPLRVRGANKEEAEKLARELLAKVGLAERAHHYPSELSGGQQQRVAIARALAVKPKMMLFDEPTSALDPELRHEVLKVMQDLAEEGMTMVIVTHEIGFAEKVASRLIFIDKGRIAEDGDPQVLIKNPPSQRLQEFLQHVS